MNTLRHVSLAVMVLALGGLAPAQEPGADKAKAAQEAVDKAKKARAEGKHEEAVTILEAVYASLSSNAEAVLMLADSAVQSAQYDKAVTYGVKAADLAKDNPEAHKVAAAAFFNRAEEAKVQPGATQGKIDGFYEDALSFTQAALKLKADDVDTWVLQGEILFLLSRPKDSADAYAKAVALQPDNINWLYYAARGHRAAGNFGVAVELIDKAIKLQPGLAWLHREKGNILAASPAATGPEEAAQAYAAALKTKELDDQTRAEVPRAIFGLLGQAKPAEARRLIEGWSETHPQDIFAWWWLGFYDVQAKNYEAGFKNFTKTFELSGGAQADAALWAGYCQAQLAGGTAGSKVDLEKLEAAAAWMVKAAKVQGWQWGDRNNDPVAKILGLGAPLAEAGRFDTAAGLLEKHLLPIAAEDYRLFNNLGFLYREIGSAAGRGAKAKEQWTKSREYYEKSAALVVKDPGADNTAKAQVLNDTGLMWHYHFDDVAKGVEYYKKALGFDPNYIDAVENMGKCLFLLGKYEESVQFFEKAVKIDPARRESLQGLEKARQKLKG